MKYEHGLRLGFRARFHRDRSMAAPFAECAAIPMARCSVPKVLSATGANASQPFWEGCRGPTTAGGIQRERETTDRRQHQQKLGLARLAEEFRTYPFHVGLVINVAVRNGATPSIGHEPLAYAHCPHR